MSFKDAPKNYWEKNQVTEMYGLNVHELMSESVVRNFWKNPKAVFLEGSNNFKKLSKFSNDREKSQHQ